MYNPDFNPDETTYVRGLSSYLPQHIPDNMNDVTPYHMELPDVNPPFDTSPDIPRYAHGGPVKRRKKARKPSTPNVLPMLAEMIRQQGDGDDSILAHINPLEAMMLQQMGGSGTINKTTGLPEFSFWKKPWKAITSSMGSGLGAVIGNMIMPGIGGVVGGALGQGIQHKARGKSFGQGALKGAAIGAALPTGAGLLGQGANSLGMTGAGNFLSNYGAQNAILPSIGLGNLGSGGGVAAGESAGAGGSGSWFSNLFGGGGTGGNEVALNTLTNNVAIPGAKATAAGTAPMGYMDKLIGNSKDFFSSPANLLALASVAGSAFNRPKEKSPEKIASEHKRYQMAMQLSPSERAAKEAATLADRQMERRVEMGKYLPEERFEIKPMYRASNDPEEFKRNKRWFRYYDNPDLTGKQLLMAHGGLVPHMDMAHGGIVPQMIIEAERINYPSGEGMYFRGTGKGQADDIDAKVSAGEYTFPADVVAHLGDGNNEAGGIACDRFVANVRRYKGAKKGLPPKIKPLSTYFRR